MRIVNKWLKFKHRIHLATAYRWFLSLENDLLRLGMSNPKVVFDVGAHLGQTTLHFHKKFKKAHIHSFEPVTQNFQNLARNIGNQDRIFVNEIALGSSVGTALIKEGISDLTHSISTSSPSDKTEDVQKVAVETVDYYMDREKINEIDLLKIDTEGHEIDVLKGAENTIKSGRIKAIFAECDFCMKDMQHTYFPDLLEYLSEKNFSMFGLYDVMHYGKNHGIGYCNALFLNSSTFPEIYRH